jgi:hypothetical protein
MRKTILTGLTTAVALAAVAGPAYAQTVAPPTTPTTPAPAASTPAVPSQPNVSPAQPQMAATIHIKNCTVKSSRNAGGYTWASCSIVGTNLPNQGVRLSYKSNLKAFNPGTLGPWRHTSGTVGVAGGDTILALKFGFKGKTVSQVRKSLKITISNATNGAMITSATAVASAPAAA